MPVKYTRPSWEDLLHGDHSTLVAKRSTCRRRAVGAVIVRDKRMLSTGYNGAPTGFVTASISVSARSNST